MTFPTIKQKNKMDCGLTCLQIILRHYKVKVPLNALLTKLPNASKGATLTQLSAAGTALGFECNGVGLSVGQLREVNYPCIVHWLKNHFVVVVKFDKDKVIISDPGPGLLVSYTLDEFRNHWLADGKIGYALLLTPTEKLIKGYSDRKKNLRFLYSNYVRPFKNHLALVVIGLIIGLVLTTITPFLTKALVDVGINNKDLSFIDLILIGQLMIAVSTTSLNTVRSWIFLKIGMQMNISVISDFLAKIMRLPVSFFDSNLEGDVLQRINDQYTVKGFVSATTMNIIFSFFNLIIFGSILAFYSFQVFSVFLIFSIIYVFWVLAFLKKRKEYDYKLYDRNRANQNILIQLVSGIREIKLYNNQPRQKKLWEDNQLESFNINAKQMATMQYQQNGAYLIDLLKGILISYITAKLVIEGKITFGTMLSIQYILGQLNVPILQIVGFTNVLQDAMIGIERISDIYNTNDEDSGSLVPNHESIIFKNVSFAYNNEVDVLKQLNFKIPKGQVTAIVGSSGSGKTSIIKLLMKFYTPQTGDIFIGNETIAKINNTAWRNMCGVVSQESFLFTESIFKNIAFGDEKPDMEKVVQAAKLANIHDFISNLIEGYSTVLGTGVQNLSQGQKQRIFIARAIYKEPAYIFFDEATNSLDAINEKLITDNLIQYFKGKTVLLIAHRLQTVAAADQIIVLDKGEIIETGRHQELLDKNGLYKKLIENQI